jgi:hypothetical protein
MLHLCSSEWHRNCTACVQPQQSTREQDLRTPNHLTASMLTAALPQTAVACPTKPAHPVIAFAPGAATYSVGRALGRSLPEMRAQTFVPDKHKDAGLVIAPIRIE